MNFKKTLAYAWTAPLTVPTFLLAAIALISGWIRWEGIVEDAFVFTLKHPPSWLKRKVKRSLVVGQIMLVTERDHEKRTLVYKHALVHVQQNRTFGVFYPLMWWFSWLLIKLMKHGDPYYDNPFEIDARRGAGQYVDVPGLLKKLGKLTSQ